MSDNSMLKRTEIKKDDLQLETLVKIVNDIQILRDKIIFLIAITTGARVSEIANLNRDDVICKHTVRGCECFLNLSCKGCKEKELFPIHIGLYNMICEYLKSRCDNSMALFIGRSNSSKERLAVGSITILIKRYFRKHGIDSPRITAHSLRHTFITTLMKATGENLPLVMQYARHKNPISTIIYTHIDSWHRELTEAERLNNKCSNSIMNMIKGV